MQLPTSLLLLTSASAAATAYQYINTAAYGYGVAPTFPNRIIHNDEFGKHQRPYMDVHQTTYRRQKRATIAFNRAWKVMLKTTVGYQNIYGDYGEGIMKIKAFAKVGSADEAARDFYSLMPTHIEQVPHDLMGEVGNKGILLNLSEPPNIILKDMYRESQISISYFETFAQAENRLRKWKERFRMQ